MSSEPQQGGLGDIASEVIKQIDRLDMDERYDWPLVLRYGWRFTNSGNTIGMPTAGGRYSPCYARLATELKQGRSTYVLRLKLKEHSRERILHFKEVKPAIFLMASIAQHRMHPHDACVHFEVMLDDEVLDTLSFEDDQLENLTSVENLEAIRNLFKVAECAMEAKPPATSSSEDATTRT